MAYGNALDQFPVEAGQIWRAGNHVFLCADVTVALQNTELSELFAQIGRETADVIYTDPPWNMAIQKRFHKLAGIAPPTDFIELLVGMVMVYERYCPKGLVWLEMGVTHRDLFSGLLEVSGARVLAEFEGTYGSKQNPSSSAMFCVTWDVNGVESAPSPGEVLHDKQLLNWVMDQAISKPGMVYFDPCCGNLTYGMEAIKRGAQMVGVELIPAKLAQGLEKLAKAGAEPVKVTVA